MMARAIASGESGIGAGNRMNLRLLKYRNPYRSQRRNRYQCRYRSFWTGLGNTVYNSLSIGLILRSLVTNN